MRRAGTSTPLALTLTWALTSALTPSPPLMTPAPTRTLNPAPTPLTPARWGCRSTPSSSSSWSACPTRRPISTDLPLPDQESRKAPATHSQTERDRGMSGSVPAHKPPATSHLPPSPLTRAGPCRHRRSRRCATTRARASTSGSSTWPTATARRASGTSSRSSCSSEAASRERPSGSRERPRERRGHGAAGRGDGATGGAYIFCGELAERRRGVAWTSRECGARSMAERQWVWTLAALSIVEAQDGDALLCSVSYVR